MSFVIWYKVKIEEGSGPGGLGAVAGAAAAALGVGGLPVTFSNDIFAGQYVLDADLRLTMSTGAAAQQFAITVYNLPAGAVDAIKKKHGAAVKGGNPLRASIHLGYFEDSPLFTAADPVLVGAITAVHTSVDAQGMLVAELRGQELGGYRLRAHRFSMSSSGPVEADSILAQVASETTTEVAPGSTLNKSFPDFLLNGSNALQALEEIARRCDVPLVVRDNKIFMSGAVGEEKGPTFSAARNIVKMDMAEYSEEIPDPLSTENRIPVEALSAIEITVLGEPKVRVGQVVTLDVEDRPPGMFRVDHLVHEFSTRSGYICVMRLLDVQAGAKAARSTGAEGIVERLHDLVESTHDRRAGIDVGQVKSYQAGKDSKHLATLNYGQAAAADVVNPSVQTPLRTETPLLHNKPIASPFAWHKVGLVVPVYPGMRALLAHNRGLANDAVVSGFLWSEAPRNEPPQNAPGDYWLCLPTELGPDGRPVGKGVNDLTDRDGYRVIQAKGLQITVGASKLAAVGARPDPKTEESILIEHHSGTTIEVANDGSIKIETAGKEISLSNGSVGISLTGSSVKVT